MYCINRKSRVAREIKGISSADMMQQHPATLLNDLFVFLGQSAVYSWSEGFLDATHEQTLLPVLNRWFKLRPFSTSDFKDGELPVFQAFLRDLPKLSGESLRLTADSLSEFLRDRPRFRGPPFTEDFILRRLHDLVIVGLEMERKDWSMIVSVIRCIR